ncbi:hypothetical protein RZS08_18810, partial [Arthrospira platensis SPKY1]|nr:hypothetical protein [Arthrospira platensis SPKY1]
MSDRQLAPGSAQFPGPGGRPSGQAHHGPPGGVAGHDHIPPRHPHGPSGPQGLERRLLGGHDAGHVL